MLNNGQTFSIERSVGRQVIVIIVGITLVIFTLLYILAARHLQSQFDTVLRAKAEAVVSVTERDEEGIESDYSENVMREYSAGADAPFFLQIRNPDGSNLIKSSSLGNLELDWFEGAGSEADFRDVTLPDGGSGRQVALVFIPRLEENPEDGVIVSPIGPVPLRLTIAHSRKDLDQALLVLMLALAGSALVMTIILVAGIRRIVRSGLEPLRDGSRQIKSLDPSDLSARVNLARMPQELEPIVGELNRLLARVEEAFARESRFSADVAHELRTPLAELKAASEVARALSGDPAVRQFFADVHDIEQQMNRMVEVLLTLSRCESGRLDLPLAPVGLADLVGEIVGDLDQAGKFNRIALGITGDIGVISHRESLRMVLRNLLANAVLYSPAGSAITCQAGKGDHGVDVSVTNTVSDLERDDIANLFERFWQRDPSRTSSGHFGLGLPLVKALCGALGLTVGAVLEDGKLTIKICGLEPCAVESEPAAEQRQSAAAE